MVSICLNIFFVTVSNFVFCRTDGAVGGVEEPTQSSEEQLEEPVVKKQRTDGYGKCFVLSWLLQPLC